MAWIPCYEFTSVPFYFCPFFSYSNVGIQSIFRFGFAEKKGRDNCMLQRRAVFYIDIKKTMAWRLV